MRKLILLVLFSLCALPATGQHPGGYGASGRGGTTDGRSSSGNSGNNGFGRRGFGSGIPIGGFDHRFGVPNRFRPYGVSYPYVYPLLDGRYDSHLYPSLDNAYGYAPPPSVIIVEPPPPQVIVQQAPPESVHPVVHDYKDLSAAGAPTSLTGTGEEPHFVIALNDGSRISASLVWVQGSVVHYVDTEDRQRQVPLQSVDRQSTRTFNRERNLELRLPAPE